MPRRPQSVKAKMSTPEIFPVLPLRDVVIFPNMVMPLFVGRSSSIKALDISLLDHDKQILLVAQKQATTENPGENDLYHVGTIASILQLLKLPDGTVKVLVEGQKRVCIDHFNFDTEAVMGLLSLDATPHQSSYENVAEAEAMSRSIEHLFEQYVKLNKKIPPEVLTSLIGLDDHQKLADAISAHLAIKHEEKQKLLEAFDLKSHFDLLMKYLDHEIEILQMEKQINSRVKKQMEKNQREYYLNERMKAIQQELGDMDKATNDIDGYRKRIESSGMSQEAKEKALAELNKLKMMPPMAAEAAVSRNYLDALLNLPWKKFSKVNRDLKKAEKILNDEHDGLEKVKERILEYLAVQARVKKIKGPILCLVGPPGVGKTSLGKSIAHATGRNFVRMSLGGVRDEAEIRGHRRTYIGSFPGKIIQNVSKAGAKNPLFLLDEVDKMAMDFRGDPASALLEVLDPEQNNMFNDHYLEVDYDLSDVMFVTTANTLDIPPPLLDRMEVIELSGYTEDEKVLIAQNHLLVKQRKENGLKENELEISEQVIREVIQYYTREAGVRNLERELAKICRKVVKELLLDPTLKQVVVQSDTLEKYLGVRHYRYDEAKDDDQVGQVTGLAWTEVGGELLTIEAATTSGDGKNIITGQLGEVMQESIQAAMTVVKARAERLSIPQDYFKQKDIHVHVPEGAIPKDGPSAGIAMCTALVSVLTGCPVRADLAMTGEITLRGEILPIGGLKEKLLAARRGGIKHVIIPEENQKDLKEIPKTVTNNLEIHPLRWIDDVLQFALKELPTSFHEKNASQKKSIQKSHKKEIKNRKAKSLS